MKEELHAKLLDFGQMKFELGIECKGQQDINKYIETDEYQQKQKQIQKLYDEIIDMFTKEN